MVECDNAGSGRWSGSIRELGILLAKQARREPRSTRVGFAPPKPLGWTRPARALFLG